MVWWVIKCYLLNFLNVLKFAYKLVCLIKVMVEAATDEMCRENVGKIVKVLHEKGHVPD